MNMVSPLRGICRVNDVREERKWIYLILLKYLILLEYNNIEMLPLTQTKVMVLVSATSKLSTTETEL